MAQATERIGETFGIGLLHPGRTEGAVPRFIPPGPRGIPVEAFLVSSAVVGLAEIGDKTQILAIVYLTKASGLLSSRVHCERLATIARNQ